MHVRVCRDCGEEYRPEIARCADCGGELADRHEDEYASAAREPFEDLPPEAPPDPPDDVVIHGSDAISDLTPLADRLVDAGIEVRLRHIPSHGGERSAGYQLRVRERDRERALRELAPRLAPTAPSNVQDVDRHFDPSVDDTRCPACGATPPAGATECPECGLAIGGDAEGP